MHTRFRESIGYVAIVFFGLFLFFLVYQKTQKDYATALDHYQQASEESTKIVAIQLENTFRDIYQNLRTISFLPGVQNIDRHAKGLSDDARQSIQKIYNNLSNNVNVSEIYIVPVDLDPAKIDPETNAPEEPIIMFDTEVSNVEKNPDPYEEVEIYEYRQLKEQMDWLKKKYPNNSNLKKEDLPMISGAEVITCDNSDYRNTLDDNDRKGVLFSVPFYDANHVLKGTVTAVIRTNSIRALLPKKNYSLINPGYKYVVLSDGEKINKENIELITQYKKNENLFYSDIIPLSGYDPLYSWYLWVGFPQSDFLKSGNVTSIRDFSWIGYGSSFALMSLLLVFWYFLQKNICYIRNRNMALEKDLQDRIAEIEAFNKQKEEQKQKAETQKKMHLERIASSFEGSMEKIILELSASATHLQKDARNVADIASNTKTRSTVVAQCTTQASEKAVGVRNAMNALSEKSSLIDEVTLSISSIVSQINLLAVNATIEAVRAGEAGKGFSVVSNEVKSLADQVAKASVEIKRQIIDIQEATQNSIHAVMEVLCLIDNSYMEDQSAELHIDSISENILFVQEGAAHTEETAQQVLHSADQLSKLSGSIKSSMKELLQMIRGRSFD